MKKCIIFILGCVALVSVSCVKEKDARVGTLIRFSAETEYLNEFETRTLYSNVTVTTGSGTSANKYERINWISGDDIRILYKHGSDVEALTTYNVTVPPDNTGSSTVDNQTVTGKNSRASVTASGTALEWADGTPVFYGVYPATVPTGETAPSVSSSGVVTNLSIPATQTATFNSDQGRYLPNMRKAYMVSYAADSQISGSSVTLPFTPVMNAFEFKLKLTGTHTSLDDIQAVQLSSTNYYLAGTYQVSITGYANDAVTWSFNPTQDIDANASKSKHITVDFKNASNTSTNPSLSKDDYLNFTILTIPDSRVNDLTLTIKYTDGALKTVSLAGLSLAGKLGQKFVITNEKVPNLEYDYYITQINDITLDAGHTGGSRTITIESYKQDKMDASNKKPVPWKIQYTTNNGSTWTDLPSGGYQNFTASLRSHNTGGVPNNGQTSTISLGGTASSTTHVDCPASLKANTYGTSSNRWDLSKNGLSNSANAINTANCYIVTGPGEYMFPVVYGNAIKGSTTNTSAFAPMNASSDGITQTEAPFITHLSDVNTTFNTTGYPANYYLPKFWNVNAGAISSPFIATDLSVGSSWEPIVVWQDVPDGDEIIPYSSEYIGTTTGTIGNTSNVAYIWFKIDADHIKPGNIVIAMKGTGSTVNYILWSWHIWIPEETPSASNSFMNRNLGQVTQVPVTDYAARSLKFRILQTETGGTYKDFTVTQNAHQTTGSSETRNTYYQWGRKDPMLNTNSADYVSLNPDLNLTRANVFTSFQGWNFSTNDIDRGRGIRAPYWLLQNSKTHSWMDGNVYPNFSSVTTEDRYYIKSPTDNDVNKNPDNSDHKKTGPFTATQKNSLSATQFIHNGNSWTKVKDAGWYVPASRQSSVRTTNYTTSQIDPLVHPYYLTYNGVNFYADVQGTNGLNWADNPWYCFILSDFQYDSSTDKWTLVNPRFGSFTQVQATYLMGIDYNGSDHTTWDYYAENMYNYSGTFYYGPYNTTDAIVLMNCGFIGGAASDPNVDFWGETVTTSTPYTVTERNESSIVYNLWNSYIYAQDTQGEPYSNKYKTVYDPCPPGYTVPTKTIAGVAWSVSGFPSRGALPNESSNYDVSGYTYNVNGYWTDHPLGIKPTGANVDLTDLSNYQDYDKAYMKVVGESGNAEKLRSTAASIRPMVDPK